MRESTRELIALPAAVAAPAPDGPLARLLAAERSRAERLLNSLRLALVALLAIAAIAYAPAIPDALCIANVVVLFPMLAWSMWQAVLGRRDGGSLPAWLSAVSPAVDATAVTAIVISYGLFGAPILALKAPIALVYFVILAARPMTGSPRSTATTTIVILVEYALILAVLLPVAGGVTADPMAAAEGGRVSLLDEGMKLALLAACGAISTYATAWHQRVLTRALAGQLARDTEQRELAARLQEADKLAALGILAASIAHEVNNPLSAIALSADLLARGATDDATREELVAIAGDARRTANVVKNLLSFARTDHATRAAISIDEPVERALGTVRSLLRDRGITVETSLAARDVEMSGDAASIERVVINLVINAAQAMEGQTGERIVRVTTWDDADSIRLMVEDTGPGFAPGAAERLFERFFTTKPAGKGTGLGLWMVAQVVEMHGGTISATDTGSGARFSLVFPRLSDAAAA